MSVALKGVRQLEIRRLNTDAATMLSLLGETVSAAYGGPDNPRCRKALAVAAAHVDGALRAAVRPPSAADICVLRGLLIDQDALGRTPPIWSAVDEATCRPLDLQLLLLARMLGQPFGWHGQQEGRLVNNVMPARGYENVQTGASSTMLLSPHTEDAFHPRRSHLFLLACIRNPDHVATTVSSVRDVELDPADRAILTRPVVPILPDLTYGDYAQRDRAQPVPTLWQRADGLCLRYDPDYTPWADGGPEYRAAYRRLGAELERVARAVVLEPGDVAIVDNDVVVHGRVPFTARFDGTDRWLKRVNIAVPGRPRPAAEQTESGYGQQIRPLHPEFV